MDFVRRPPTRVGFARAVGMMLAAVVAAAGPAATAGAHETDQFTLPATDDLADLGPDVTRWYYEALAAGVARANDRIDAAIRAGRPANEVDELEKPTGLVDAVDASFLRGNDIVDSVEQELASPAMARRHPGRRVFFREADHNIYDGAFSIFDPRILSRFWFGSTIKLFGHLVGTDKFGHFSAIGISYYWRYAEARRYGATEGEATRAAVRFGTTGRWSEADLMGLTTTGDYANGDLSANFAGLLFFRDLTEPTFVGGAVRPPLAVRDGHGWRLAPHVRPDSDFLRPFVTDHWNEALNPGWFIDSMRPTLRAAVRDRTATILRYYAPPTILDAAGLRDYFRGRRMDLSTYWGQDYGHRGDDGSVVGIDNTCFDGPRRS